MEAKYHYDLVQGTPEWTDIRLGKVGGSSCAPLLVSGKNEYGLGKGAMTLLFAKAEEQIERIPYSDFKSDWMERGNEIEYQGREVYEMQTGYEVDEIGYISFGPYFGVSPDGLIGDSGGLELKSPRLSTYLEYELTGKPNKDHIAQCQWALWITGREWWDYVVYHPKRPLIINRVLPCQETHDRFRKATKVYTELMDQILNK